MSDGSFRSDSSDSTPIKAKSTLRELMASEHTHETAQKILQRRVLVSGDGEGLYDVSGDDDNAVSAAKNISTAVERTTFAALGHQRAGREPHDFLRYCKDLGVAKLGERYRLVNALEAAKKHDKLPSLLDVQSRGMVKLPAGRGASADVSNLVNWARSDSLKAQARRSHAACQNTMNFLSMAMVHTLAPEEPRAPPPLPRAENRADAKLVLFIACHCKDAARLSKLRRCLRSVCAQMGAIAQPSSSSSSSSEWEAADWPLAGVLVSWSAEDETLRKLCRITFDDLLKVPAGVCAAFERPESLTQLQHLASLLPEATRLVGADGSKTKDGGGTNEVWVMFSDDDDVFHPARCAAYKRAIEVSPEEAHAVSASWVARPLVSEEKVESAGDVERLVASGRAVRTPKAGSEKEGGGGAWDEYWNTSLRLKSLTTFFEVGCPPSGRTSKYADIALYYYLKYAVPTMRFVPHNESDFTGCWMHYYDKPIKVSDAAGQGAASSGASLAKGDIERAVAMRETLIATRATLEAASPADVAKSKGAAGVDIESLIVTIQKFLEAEDAVLSEKAAAVKKRGGGGDVAEDEFITPLTLFAAQLRSILELFCAGFVGAPNLPPEPIFFECAQELACNNLQALGHPPAVVALVCGSHVRPVFEECAVMFGLHIALWGP